MRYQRANAVGRTYFCTVNLVAPRSDLLVRYIDDLRAAIKSVKNAHPFAVLTMGCYLNTCMRYGACHRAPPTIRYVGHLSRPDSRGGWQKASAFVPAAKPSVSEASGSGGLGNIKSGMRLILRGTSITFISIL